MSLSLSTTKGTTKNDEKKTKHQTKHKQNTDLKHQATSKKQQTRRKKKQHIQNNEKNTNTKSKTNKQKNNHRPKTVPKPGHQLLWALCRPDHVGRQRAAVLVVTPGVLDHRKELLDVVGIVIGLKSFGLGKGGIYKRGLVLFVFFLEQGMCFCVFEDGGGGVFWGYFMCLKKESLEKNKKVEKEKVG